MATDQAGLPAVRQHQRLPQPSALGATRRSWWSVMTVRVQSRRDLAKELWLAAVPPAHDPAEHVEQLAAARRRPDPAWSRVTIPVDGRLVGFAWLAVVGQLDLQPFLCAYRADRHGHPAYDPKTLLCVLLYGYATGVRSSRQIQRRYHRGAIFDSAPCGRIQGISTTPAPLHDQQWVRY